MVNLTKVYKINGCLVVSHDINSAVSIFSEYYPYTEIKDILLVEGDGINDYHALIRKDTNDGSK